MLPAKVMALNLVTLLINVLFVGEMEKLDLIRGFLPFNKPVHNVKELEKKLLTHVLTVTVKVISMHQKKYLSQYLKVLMMVQE